MLSTSYQSARETSYFRGEIRKWTLLPGLALVSLISGCAHAPASPDNTSDAPQSGETPAKVAKTAARVVVMKVASTPVKVITAAGTVAKKVEEKVDQKIEGDNPPQ